MTAVPAVNEALQVDPQFTPDGELVTVPLPLPDLEIERVYTGTGVPSPMYTVGMLKAPFVVFLMFVMRYFAEFTVNSYTTAAPEGKRAMSSEPVMIVVP